MKCLVFAVGFGSLLLKSCYVSYLHGLIGDQIMLILNKLASSCLKALASFLEQINDGVWRTNFSLLLQKLNDLRFKIRSIMKMRFASFVLFRPWSEQICRNQSVLKNGCRFDCLGWPANVGLRHNCAKIYEGFRQSL